MMERSSKYFLEKMKKFLPNNLMTFRLANGFSRNCLDRPAGGVSDGNVKIDLLESANSGGRDTEMGTLGLATTDHDSHTGDSFFDEF
jgi:hypothetical protein